MSESDCKTNGENAKNIALKSARLTLLWPLALHMKEPPQRALVMDHTVDGIANDIEAAFHAANGTRRKHLWRPVDDPLEHIPRPERPTSPTRGDDKDNNHQAKLIAWQNDAYAEAVYFHEFVQAFLYQKRDDDTGLSPLRLFTRTDIRYADIRFADIEKTVSIERVNLYFFRTGVAVFTMDMLAPPIEETGTNGWSLAEFEDFHDLTRRVYAPFFLPGGNGKRCQGPLVIDNITWRDEDKNILKTANGQEMCFHLSDKEDLDVAEHYVGTDDLEARRHPPLFRHWRTLLPEQMAITPYDDFTSPRRNRRAKGGSLAAPARWRHVVDERMPTLAVIDVTDQGGGMSAFRAIRRSDFMRLCFADGRGDGGLPYDETFLKTFEADHCYDRFFSSGTRYMASGYSFVAVIAGSDAWIPALHMTRHYFQMALIAHMENASLLGFSAQISGAVRHFASKAEPKSDAFFERAMDAIEEQFLLFVHNFRFTGVSSQVQGKELFELMRRHLDSQALFEDVQTEIATANTYLQTRASRRTSVAGEKLAVIGSIAVLLGVIIGLSSMNLFFSEAIWDVSKEGDPWDRFLASWRTHGRVAGAIVGVVGVLGFLVMSVISKGEEHSNLNIVKWFSLFLTVFGLTVFGVALILSA